ncbi:MAG: SixA phosphatase family protein [Acidimicrobiales bacterium]
MPTVLVLRHGKSDWDAEYHSDIDRPLAKRGRRAAKTIGRYLADVGPEPTLAMTSPASRARDTLERVLEVAGFDCPVRIVESFYGKGTEAVLDDLRSLDESFESVLVVGHEPTWSDLIATLTGSHVRFPTAALARIDLDEPWAGLDGCCATLTKLVLPRELEASGC